MKLAPNSARILVPAGQTPVSPIPSPGALQELPEPQSGAPRAPVPRFPARGGLPTTPVYPIPAGISPFPRFCQIEARHPKPASFPLSSLVWPKPWVYPRLCHFLVQNPTFDPILSSQSSSQTCPYPRLDPRLTIIDGENHAVCNNMLSCCINLLIHSCNESSLHRR